MGSGLKKYQSEILSIHQETGKKSDSIAEILRAKYPEDKDTNWGNLGRAIRHHKILPQSDFNVTLEESNLMPTDNWSHGWIKSKNASVFVKNPDFKKSEAVSYEQMRDEFIVEMKKYSPSFKTIKRKENDGGHLLVIDIADLHLGKLSSPTETGEKYNVELAVAFALKGVEGIIQKSSGFDIDQILFVIGNDVLHFDTPKGNTTSGTVMDTDGMWYDNFKLARQLYTGIIEALVQMADVAVVHCPSNHDFMSGFMLADSVSCYFAKHNNITFDVTNAHRKYYRYHNSLIGLSHGDGAKMQDMPLLMANEAKKDWAETDHRYIYLHHVHHQSTVKFQSGKDYQGATVEYLRSPSASDGWHKKFGFCHAPRAIEGFIHSKKNGQVCKISHIF